MMMVNQEKILDLDPSLFFLTGAGYIYTYNHLRYKLEISRLTFVDHSVLELD